MGRPPPVQSPRVTLSARAWHRRRLSGCSEAGGIPSRSLSTAPEKSLPQRTSEVRGRNEATLLTLGVCLRQHDLPIPERPLTTLSCFIVSAVVFLFVRNQFFKKKKKISSCFSSTYCLDSVLEFTVTRKAPKPSNCHLRKWSVSVLCPVWAFARAAPF